MRIRLWGRRIACASILAVSLFGATARVDAEEPAAHALGAKLKATGADLEALTDDRYAPFADLRSLAAEIDGYLIARDGNALADRLERISADISTLDPLKAEARLIQELGTVFSSASSALTTRDKAQHFIQVSHVVSELLTKRTDLPRTDVAVRGGFDELLAAVITFSGGDIFDSAKTSAATLTAGLANEATRRKLASDQAAAKAMDDLYVQIGNIKASRSRRIHVEGALYGDVVAIVNGVNAARQAGYSLIQIGDGLRFCDATAAVRTACERQESCTLPTDFRTSLCGFDPAEFLDPRDKGAVVFYRCEGNLDPFWTGLPTEGQPAFGAGKIDKAPVSTASPLLVTIQSEKQGIACERKGP